ncbi:MAG: tRNA (N(6)-L-threonylcarbamoyladenosine(37)-C(2))-methylthiotransferase MtaB [Oscillospiraceae bacterium]|jgi:threonylcarbamoyladenosine tRNA methylthiotransferase MtaB|nr:tRNA (N(6)-L-threonylcarbamoyladenosine(37)-C(2))-methylthiotransferase MtaB [Oscillospiraceae bacterium]
MRFYIETLGCKVNQSESRSVAALLTRRGHTEARRGEPCDVIIVNTCAVTGEASRRSRQTARRLKRLFPDAVLAICGCAGDTEPRQLRELGAAIVFGSGDRAKFADTLEAYINGDQRDEIDITADSLSPHGSPADDIKTAFELLPVGDTVRARASLKIQDGCDSFCAYCVIPYARGRSRSIPIPEAAERARELSQRGFREIIVTGIEICSYGHDLGSGENLSALLRAISKAAPDSRIRLGSLEPSRVDAELIQTLTDLPRVCDHFHISLQSGSAATLRRMRRRYTPQELLDLLARLRGAFPDAGVTADVIAGFPGETDAELRETAAFLEQCAFSDLHVFPYSVRPGTAAAAMENQIPSAEKKSRAAILRDIGARTRAAFIATQYGKTAEVLFEREENGFSTGHSGNYLEIREKITDVRGMLLPVVMRDGNVLLRHK